MNKTMTLAFLGCLCCMKVWNCTLEDRVVALLLFALLLFTLSLEEGFDHAVHMCLGDLEKTCKQGMKDKGH